MRQGHQTRRRKYVGGGKTKLPLNVSITNTPSFFKNWNTYYVSGHGALLPRRFVVPPNTYILHSRGAGYKCSGEFPLEKILKMGDKGFDEDRFFEFLKNPKSVLPTIYTSPKQPFRQDDEYTQIYEPGDVIFDLFIDFHNPWRDPKFFARTGRTFFGLFGIFPVPILHKLAQDQYSIDTRLYKIMLQGRPKEEIETFLMNQETKFFKQPGNNVSLFINENGGKTTTTLSTLILSPLLGASEPEKPRFIVVRACRGLQGLDHSLNIDSETLQKVRRQSFSLRNRTLLNEGAAAAAAAAAVSGVSEAAEEASAAGGGGPAADIVAQISAPPPSTDLSWYSLTPEQRIAIDMAIEDPDFKRYLSFTGKPASLILYDTYGVINTYLNNYNAIRERFLTVNTILSDIVKLFKLDANANLNEDTIKLLINIKIDEYFDICLDIVRPYVNLPEDTEDIVLLVYTLSFYESFKEWLKTQQLVQKQGAPVRDWKTFLGLGPAGKQTIAKYFFKCGKLLDSIENTVIDILYEYVRLQMPESIDCTPKKVPTKPSSIAKK